MPHPVPTRFSGLAVALESTGGTPETINLSTDAIQLAEPTTPDGPLYVNPNRREGVLAASLSRRPAVPAAPGGRHYRIPFRMEARGAGSAYSASNLPPEDPILIAAGLSRSVSTTSGSESVTYTPDDSPNTGTNDTLTVQFQYAQREYILTNGVVEGLALEVDAGGIAYWTGSILGVYSTDTEQAVEAHTYSTVSPAIWQNSGPLDIGGVTSIVGRRMVVSMENTIVVLPAPDASGISRIMNISRAPMVALTAETLAKSTWDPEDDYASVTARTFDATIGGTQYQRLKVDMDAAYVDNVARSDQDEIAYFDVDYGARIPAAGNEIAFVYD